MIEAPPGKITVRVEEVRIARGRLLSLWCHGDKSDARRNLQRIRYLSPRRNGNGEVKDVVVANTNNLAAELTGKTSVY